MVNNPPILSGKQLFLFQIACYIGGFLSHFMANIINVALPTFTQIFHDQVQLVQWISVGYMLTIAITLPLFGELADRMGYRSLHNLGYLLFCIGTILIALSPNLIFLLLCRTTQAIGASMFQATNMALITIHTPKDQRGRAIGLFSTAVALGALCGPVTGGFIIEWFDWHWMFWANVPFIFIAMYLSYTYIPRMPAAKSNHSTDWIGILLFACTIGTLIIGVSNAPSWGWTSHKVAILFGLTFFSGFLLFIWEKRQHIPFLPFHLFQNPSMNLSFLLIFSAFLIANTALISIPFYLTKIIQLPAYQVGYIMMIYPIVVSFIGPVAGNLSDHYGSKPFTVMGPLIIFLGSFIIVVLHESLTLFDTSVALTLLGFGVGITSSPTNRLIMELTPKSSIGIIGGTIALFRNIGILIGSSMSLSLLTGDYPIKTSITIIFTTCSIISLTCLCGFLYVYWKNYRSNIAR